MTTLLGRVLGWLGHPPRPVGPVHTTPLPFPDRTGIEAATMKLGPVRALDPWAWSDGESDRVEATTTYIGRSFAGKVRFYGDGTTIHSIGHLDIEVHGGKVVAVWYRCQMLPFTQHEIASDRVATVYATDYRNYPAIRGVVLDEEPDGQAQR